MNCDQSKMEFDEFLKKYETFKDLDMSESDTRSKLIDYLLLNVLGWNEEDIRREGHVNSGFFDYKISIAGFNIVVEAKKTFKQFIIPNTNKRKIKISTIYNENKEVIDQIRKYLDDLGCDKGLITNGKQFIISKFINTNNIPWKQNQCCVFNSLEDISEHFVEFWNNLSKESIIRNRGLISLSEIDLEFSKTILSTITNKDNEITRNDFSAKIIPLINKVFGEIFDINNEFDDLEFIKACYVENKEIKKNKSELNKLFGDNSPSLNEVIKARNHQSVKKQITNEINTYIPKCKDSPTPKPIIIIGSRGVGKTTFINYLFKNDIPDDIICNYPYIYINLMKYYFGTSTLDYEIIAKDTIDQIDEKFPSLNINSFDVLKRIYIKEINQRERGIWNVYKNDTKTFSIKVSEFLAEKVKKNMEHLKAINQYITREIHKRIILVFDNADQLEDKIQEELFLHACSLNTNAKFGVIISLREGYYYKWRAQPPFNAFESNVYHITTPDYSIVLQKRINYAIEKIKDEKNKREVIKGDYQGKSLIMNEDKIEEFFTSIRDSLFCKENTPILNFIQNTTFPNIREGLRIFKIFLTSGYTDVTEYVLRLIYNRDQKEREFIPIHEFVQTVGLENKLYYNHEMSNILNLFYPVCEFSDYFIKIYLLRKLEEKLNYSGNIDKYVDYYSIIDEFSKYGYIDETISSELKYLINKNCIETDKMISDVRWEDFTKENFNITITPKGLYYIKEVINHFYYIDMILQDTPIFSKIDFNNLRINFPLRDEHAKRDMNKRIISVEYFIDYLKKIEHAKCSQELNNKYGCITDNILAYGLSADIEQIKKTIK